MFEAALHTENDIAVVADDLLKFFPDICVFLFEGQMGAGKTTFIKGLCTALGVKDGMSSPTYSIVNEYSGDNSSRIYHFDLYRLNAMEECLDIGFEEYVHSGNYCFIEWPKIALPLLPDDFVMVHITAENNVRTLKAEKRSHAV